MSCKDGLYTLPLKDWRVLLCLTNEEFKQLREKFRNNDELIHLGIKIENEEFGDFLNKNPADNVIGRIYHFADPKTKSVLKQVDNRFNKIGEKSDERDTTQFMNMVKSLSNLEWGVDYWDDENWKDIEKKMLNFVKERNVMVQYFDDDFYKFLKALPQKKIAILDFVFHMLPTYSILPNLLHGDYHYYAEQVLFFEVFYSTYDGDPGGLSIINHLLKTREFESFMKDNPLLYYSYTIMADPTSFVEDRYVELLDNFENEFLEKAKYKWESSTGTLLMFRYWPYDNLGLTEFIRRLA